MRNPERLRPIQRALLACAAWLAVTAHAHARQVPTLRQRVEDQAAVLSATERASLENQLAAYEQRTGHQFAVLTVPSLEGDPIEDFSIRVAEAWKLGDKARDDGLIVVLALQERKVRIEVGYGLEGVVTDAVSAQVIARDMSPHFRRAAYGEGLLAGLDTLMKVAAGEATGAARKAPTEDRPGGSDWLVPVVFIIIFILLSGGGRGGRRRRGGFFMFPPIGMGGWSAGGRGGFGGGGGGFGGGGGGFGGGGASGSW